jgi:hypothetical protein
MLLIRALRDSREVEQPIPIRDLGSHELPLDVLPFPKPPTLDRRYVALTSFAAVVAWRFVRRPKLRRYCGQFLCFWCVPKCTGTPVPFTLRRARWLFMPTVVIADEQASALTANIPASPSSKTLIDDAIWQSCRGGRMWNKPWSDEPTTRNVNMIAAGAVSELQSVILMVPTSKHADKERLRHAFHEAYPDVRVEAVEEYIPYRRWACGEEYTSETHTATEHTSYLFLILCFYGVGVVCAYQFIGGVFAWLLHIRSLSTVSLPDDAVTTPSPSGSAPTDSRHDPSHRWCVTMRSMTW